ncbi:sensor histidine kinase [Enterovibrio coralii]|uniref:C4-dicarboxylate transport sensor protein DctB n=1 Tax=Enterovibrio coralii TaxID=294935 RepID=A0A135IAA4_9GAMM|nr:ATP-binding protein [Enterovibrio coralii]KXF82367.1 ATPase [Enterovibrio coralii]
MQKRLIIFTVALVGLVLTAFVASFTYFSIEKRYVQKIETDVYQLQEKLAAELARYSEIPVVLSADPRLKRLLRAPESERLFDETNALLSDWNARLNSDVLYLMNRNGMTVASSNVHSERSFVGHSYHYRPYFQQAIQGQKGQYYALGVVSDKRGYYFSYPVIDGETVTGVLTLKVDLSIIDRIWNQQQFDYLIADPLGVIFYSSRDDWLYQSLTLLTEPQKKAIRDSRRYGDTKLRSLTTYRNADVLSEKNKLSISNSAQEREMMLVSTTPLGTEGWQIFGFTPVSASFPVVIQASGIFVLFYALLVLVIAAWLQNVRTRRQLAKLNDQLEIKVATRTASLEETNTALRASIEQYEKAQAALRQTESELIQAAKLAMLGEMSASINHEINQPLAAMRTYTENSLKLMEKARYQDVENNLTTINELIGLIADIIARFKVFARKQDESTRNRADVGAVISASLALSEASFIKKGIHIQCALPTEDLIVKADPVQLEQVILNLMSNAAQALSHIDDPRIGIHAEVMKDRIAIHVWDNGPGMDNDTKKRIFSPFFTTKTDGLGLGLTISRRIIESFDGDLQAQDHATGGADFVVTIPRFIEGTSDHDERDLDH